MADPRERPDSSAETAAEQSEAEKKKKEHEHEEECLDEALEETFPASDPIAPSQPDDH